MSNNDLPNGSTCADCRVRESLPWSWSSRRLLNAVKKKITIGNLKNMIIISNNFLNKNRDKQKKHKRFLKSICPILIFLFPWAIISCFLSLSGRWDFCRVHSWWKNIRQLFKDSWTISELYWTRNYMFKDSRTRKYMLEDSWTRDFIAQELLNMVFYCSRISEQGITCWKITKKRVTEEWIIF